MYLTTALNHKAQAFYLKPYLKGFSEYILAFALEIQLFPKPDNLIVNNLQKHSSEVKQQTGPTEMKEA